MYTWTEKNVFVLLFESQTLGAWLLSGTQQNISFKTYDKDTIINGKNIHFKCFDGRVFQEIQKCGGTIPQSLEALDNVSNHTNDVNELLSQVLNSILVISLDYRFILQKQKLCHKTKLIQYWTLLKLM